MLEYLFNQGNFIAVNYPAGYKEKPHCPNTQLIEICSSLAGEKIVPESFCGEVESNARYSEGAIHWLESADYHPKTACLTINQKLRKQLEIVNKNAPKPDERNFIKLSQEASTMDEKTNVTTKYNSQKEAHKKRKDIIDRWRGVIFDNCHPSETDEQNHHFRSYKSAAELPEKQIVEEAGKFIKALEGITGGKHSYEYGGRAENCKQCPHSHHFGAYTD